MDIIDVVIPSYSPDRRLLQILELMEEQTVPIRRLHLINTEEKGLTALLSGAGLTEADLKKRYPFLEILHIRKEEFDHGRTRNLGVRLAEGADYVVMMTQDALPEADDLIERLINALKADERIAAAYARQLPNRDAGAAETCTRSFNYPPQSRTKTEADLPKLGIKTFFCSNVCAAYRMDLLKEAGGFPEPMIFNEDMVYAGHAVQKGYAIRYEAEARVFHSHNYRALQQFHRNFDLGVSQAQHPEVFAGVPSEGEGIRFVKSVLRYLKENHALKESPAFLIGCAFRLAGYRLGKGYSFLPGFLVRAFTGSPLFWEQEPVRQ